ncbi:response regulator transcription factor [Streptomyces albidus (ex Kaewkla and Franco 2022)]|uniref:response regulator transcription factor n=1 Tax=Streptomyces albidus (ex Kaewkla and Franco 2022) TaxID=722709 RepID=UPI0015EF4B81|nr:response regulator transcription factor [Streptomyces albidus (ex Kaewkla and Franco 2022)]
MQRIRVLVVDDHRIFAESLAAALAAEPDVEVTAAGSAPAALRCLERAASDGRRFDVALIDADLTAPAAGASTAAGVSLNGANGQLAAVLSRDGADGGVPAATAVVHGAGAEILSNKPVLPGTSGADVKPGGIPLVGRLRSEHPAVRTVMLAERDDPRQAAAALQAGAGGWVAKDCSLSRLLQVIRGVLKDETHLSPALLTGVLKELTASRKHRTESERLVEALTPREREVLRCMVAGLGRKAVAERLYLSPHTVRTHMQNVLGKLGVHSTLAAVALARRAGVGPVDLEATAAH